MASATPIPSREASKAGRPAAPQRMTAISLEARILAQFISEPCGSMSMTQTLWAASCAAAASDEAIVLFPEPPFSLTNAMVRIARAPSF